MYQPETKTSGNNNRNNSLGLTKLTELPAVIPGQKVPCVERFLWRSRSSVVRVLPGVDKNGNILHQINDPMALWDKTNPGKHLSDTFFSCRTMKLGNQYVISQFAPGSAEEDQFPPLETFQKVIYNSVDPKKTGLRKPPHPMWKQWIDFRDGELSWSSIAVLMQALLWVVNDTQVSGDTNPPIALYGLVVLNHGPSIPVFLEALTQPMDARKPMSAIDNSNLGPVAEQNGCWLYMNSTSSIDSKGQQKTILVPSYVPAGVDPRTMEPNMYPLSDELIKALWHPWDQLLRFHNMEEQFRLIANTFGPDTVNYVFQGLDTESFIPMDIAQCGLGRYEGLVQPPRQRSHAAAIAPGSVAPAMAAPVNTQETQVYIKPTTTPMSAPTFMAPGEVEVPMVTASPATAPQKPVVPSSMQAQVDAAKAAALQAGVQVGFTPPPVPGTTPDMKFPKIGGLAPMPPVPTAGASEEDLQSLIENAK